MHGLRIAGVTPTLVRLSSDFTDARAPLFVLYNDIITQCADKARFVHTDFAGKCGLSNRVDV
jgi:hypothetical protein